MLCTLIFIVQYLWNMNERGFENYTRRYFQADSQSQIKCTMSSQGRSRNGHCHFIITSEQFEVLKKNLKLVVNESESRQLREGCLSADSKFLTESQQYTSLNPPPPMEGNSRTSFLQMRYSRSTLQACVDLEYPYG